MALDSQEDVFLQDDLGPTIAEHALQCSHLFEKYIAMPEIMPDPTLIDDQLARFKLWGSNMDVFGPPNISLDYRLRYSPTVVDIIHQLLDVICNSLTSIKPFDNPPQTPSRKRQRISESYDKEATKRVDDDPSDSDSNEDQAQKNVSIFTYTIEGTVTRLFRLSYAIRKSAKASRTHKIREYRDDDEANNAINELRLYTECYIRFRFPQAPEALRLTLVEANALRLRRLYYQMSHRRRIALSVQNPQTHPRSVQLPKIPDSTPHVHFDSSVPPKPQVIDTSPKPTSVPPAPITYATTARQTAIKVLYADSMPEVPRTKSVLVNNKLSFPPVPTTSECPYCGVILEFKGTTKSTMWNDHVIRDLEPFVCIFAQCTNSSQQEPGLLTFETSKAWIGHMQNAHGYAWECRAPSHDPIIFEREPEFQEHSRNEHDVPEAHVGTLSSAARRPVLEKILECPFGDNFSTQEKVESNTESNTVLLNETLHLHIAAHMKEIALLALQKLPSDDETSEGVASDQPLEDDGFAKLRESMYSVLDDEALDLSDLPKVAYEESKYSSSDDGTPVTTRTRGHRANRSQTSLLIEYFEGGKASPSGSTGTERKPSVRVRLTPSKTCSKNDQIQITETRSSRKRDKTKDDISNTIEGGISSSVAILDLESRDVTGMTKLHHAVQSNDLVLTKSLIEQGANLRSKAKDGKTVLHYASLSSSNNDMMKLLLEYGAGEMMDLKDDDGLAPLHYAARGNLTNKIELLAHSGASINISDGHGFSPYIWAVIAGGQEAWALLLDLGVDINSTSADGKSALGWAASIGQPEIVLSLMHHGADFMPVAPNTGLVPLEEAAACGDLSTVRSLIEYGLNPNYRDRGGFSSIHLAAEGGHNVIVDLLLSVGADVNAASQDGTTPLHCAAHGGHDGIVRTLLEHGADPSTSTYYRWTALHHAAFMGHSHVVKSLLGYMESSPSQDDHGWSVLHLAVHGRHLDTVEALIFSNHVSDSHLQCDKNGYTPGDWLLFELDSHSYKTISNLAFNKSRCCRPVTQLREAVHSNNIILAEFLLGKGKDINGKDSGKRTALYYAAKKGHIPILEMLLRRGANPNILPAGRRTWEEFISDDTILRRLWEAGYRRRTRDQVAEGRIKFLLELPRESRNDQIQRYLRAESNPYTESDPYKESSPVDKVENRSRIGKFWKRIWGQ